jgi:hypothetical protein
MRASFEMGLKPLGRTSSMFVGFATMRLIRHSCLKTTFAFDGFDNASGLLSELFDVSSKQQVI